MLRGITLVLFILASFSGREDLPIAEKISTGSKAEPYTHQIPDWLVIAADTLPIYANPLEQVFSEENPRPEEIFPRGCSSTACWRGYIATWRLQNDRLWLEQIEDCCEESRLAPTEVDALVQGRFSQGRAFADWFSGVVIIPSGERLHYEHMGYGSIYEMEIHLGFEHGMLVSRDTVSNVPTHEPLFEGGVAAYQSILAQSVDWSLSADPAAQIEAVVEIDTTGTVNVLRVRHTSDPALRMEFERAVRLGPRWTPGYMRAKPIAYTILLRLARP